MKKLEAVRYILAIQAGLTGSLSQRVEQLLKLQAELDFFQQETWLYEGYKIQKNASGEWVYLTEAGVAHPLSETILSQMCDEVLGNIKHRSMALEWVTHEEIRYDFVEDDEWISVCLAPGFLLGVVRLGISVEGKEPLQWEFVRDPLLIRYFTKLAQGDSKYR